MLSAIVFVFWPEEENYIEACLQTLSFADEIVVIDNGATTRTLRTVRKYSDKVYHSTSDNFAVRHNLGKEKATSDWLLYIDADERVSRKLATEIVETLKNPSASAYQLHRINFFEGKQVRFGDRYPDFVTRLFNKNNLVGWEGEIHESSKIKGETGQLGSSLYHLTHRDVYSMMQKTANFAEHEARLRLAANHPKVVGWRLVRVFVTEFWHRVVALQGWRQGTEGIIDGVFQAFSLFIAYVRLWELQRKPTLEESYKELDKKILTGEI